MDNLTAEFTEINTTVGTIDKQLKSSPEELKSHFESFIKVGVVHVLWIALLIQMQNKLSRDMRKSTMWFLTRSDTNQAIQLLERARGWKFCI